MTFSSKPLTNQILFVRIAGNMNAVMGRSKRSVFPRELPDGARQWETPPKYLPEWLP